MKIDRHARILELISQYDIETQEELVEYLNREGFKVTQATISRDIKELRLLKVLTPDGSYKYATVDKAEHGVSERLVRMFIDSVLSISHAENLIVVKTAPGMAMAVGAGIDAKNIDGVLGCIAGDDTVFLAIAQSSFAERIMGEIKNADEHAH